MTDHHHMARLTMRGSRTQPVDVIADLSAIDKDLFWVVMIAVDGATP